MASTKPIPVVLCGRSTIIGKPVSEHLLPEYEVIHFIQSFESAQSLLPLLLAGHSPQSNDIGSDTVGTHNYTTPPRAVILGRAFEPEQAELLRVLCAGITAQPVAWLLGDPKKKPTGPPDVAVYPGVAAREVKGVLEGWKGEEEGILLF